MAAVSDPSLSPDEIRRLHEALEALLPDEQKGGVGLDARALVAAATTALQLSRFDDALALARAALVADPRSARAWSNAGAALEAKGQIADARRAYETAVSLDDRDLATALACARLQKSTGASSSARALLTYVLLKETGAPELRAQAQALLDELLA